jgi:hypothetical protein
MKGRKGWVGESGGVGGGRPKELAEEEAENKVEKGGLTAASWLLFCPDSQ